jgi:spore coat protein CotH
MMLRVWRRLCFAVGFVCVTTVSPMAAQTAESDLSAPLFDGSVLQQVRLSLNARDWQTLKTNFTINAYYPADLRWRDMVVRNIGIRSRGTGSRSGTKPGLRVDIDRYNTNQTFLGVKSFVLRNNTQDASNLREQLSMRLFERMGLHAPREAYTQLFVNNAYVGLYSIVESIDRAFLRRTVGNDAGYLYDYDFAADDPGYYFEYRGPDAALYVPKPFKPETHEENPRGDVIERMVRTINDSGANFREAIAEFLDVTTFVRYVAIEAFIGEQDGILGDWGMNNYYFYRPDGTNRFTIFPWDKSNAFVHAVDASIWRNITDVSLLVRNRLVSPLLAQADLRELYLTALLDCVRLANEQDTAEEGGERGWLAREIDREFLQIRDSVFADPVIPYTFEQFEAAVDVLRTFARDRGSIVTAEVARSRFTRAPDGRSSND